MIWKASIKSYQRGELLSNASCNSWSKELVKDEMKLCLILFGSNPE